MMRARGDAADLAPGSNGQRRLLGIATLEDKIVQRAIVEVLNAIYDEDFLGPQTPSLALDPAFAGVTVEGIATKKLLT